MSIKIHPEAIIAAGVTIAPNVTIGRAVIEENVILDPGVVIYDNVHVARGVRVYANTVLGRIPQVAGIIQRQPKDTLEPLFIGEGSVVGANAVLYSGTFIGRNTLIGDLTCIREECWIDSDVVIGRSVLLNYNIKIHARTRIMDGSHFGGDMIIESDVFIGPHMSSANDNAMGITNPLSRQGAYICQGASIGAGVVLLANVEIGKQAIIGAGAVVDQDVPAQMIALGVPARVVKNVPLELLRAIQV